MKHGRLGQALLRSPRLTSLLARRDLALTERKRLVAVRRPQLLQHAGVTDLLDIGANKGQWGEEVRRHGYRGQLRSYEPLSEAYAVLQRVSAGDRDWTAHQVAVGDAPGTLTINVAENSQYSSFAAMHDAGVAANPAAHYVTTEQVRVDTLDSLAADVDGRIGVKVDVQGFEGQVMAGGPQTLSRAVFLEVELSLVPCYEGEPLYREMLDRITGEGFELALVEPVWLDRTTGASLQFNGLFVRPAA